MQDLDTLNKIVDQIANVYHLDKDALLDQNSDFYYLDIGNCFLQINHKTYESKCLVNSINDHVKYNKISNLFKAIQTFRYFLTYGNRMEN